MVRQLSTHPYGVYVMHLTVLSIFNYQIAGLGMDPVLRIALASPAIVCLAAASWRLLEGPIL